MVDGIPKDILEELEKSGVKFDENGNLIEEPFIKVEDDEEDDQDDEEDQDELEDENDSSDDEDDDQEDEEDEDDNSSEDEDDDDDEDDEDDEEDDKSLKLTPNSKDDDEEDKSLTVSDFENLKNDLINSIKENSSKSKKDKTDDNKISRGERELLDEARKFKKMRIEHFANEIERSVNKMDLGANFTDIVSSKEWYDYLNSKVFGAPVGAMYKDAIEESDEDAVLAFFNDFTDRYLPKTKSFKRVSKPVKKAVKAKKEKPDLSDLAVPNKSKSNSRPKRAKFDYEEADYEKKLNELERGKISVTDFNNFDEKFNKALRNGRVKKS